MKRAFILFPVLLLTSMAGLFAEDHHQSLKVYVSQAGSNQWSGGLADPNVLNTDGPLATLEAAQARVRSLLKEQTTPIDVAIRGGTYRLEEPLVLTPEDSGKQGMPVVWTSYSGERVVISGGKAITGWKKAAENLPGLPPNAAGKVWYADIGKGRTFHSLFDDLGILPQAISGRFYTDDNSKNDQTNRTMKWRGNDLANLSHTDEAILHILPSYAFVYNVLRVESINESAKTLTVKTPSGFRLHASKLPKPEFQTYYRIANIIEHLDEPGEWVVNSKTGRLPAIIGPNDTINVVAKYDVTERRDIYVVFLESGNNYGDARQTVEAGKGDVELTVVPSEYPNEKGDDFMFVVMVLPVGETWREALHLHRITGVTVK